MLFHSHWAEGSAVSRTASHRDPPGTLLVDICICDLRTTVSRKYAYADDLAIMDADGDWQEVEGVLSKDMGTVNEYLRIWNLKLNTTKTM